MPKRTAAGALEAARWRAYARYLASAPPGALALPQSVTQPGAARRLPTHIAAHDGTDGQSGGGAEGEVELLERGEMFERALPYAVALGIERTWVDKFAQAGTPIPRWLEPPVIVGGGGPTFGGPFSPYGGGYGRRWPGRVQPGRGWPVYPGQLPPGAGGPLSGAPPDGGPVTRQGGDSGGGLQGWSDRGAGGLEQASGSLVDLLNAASEVLSRGGGSDWSGGGSGGGSFGGGGGGSGGGGSGFS